MLGSLESWLLRSGVVGRVSCSGGYVETDVDTVEVKVTIAIASDSEARSS